MALQSVAALIELDRIVERLVALLEGADDLLELGKRGLEAQLVDTIGVHGSGLSPTHA